MIHVNHLSWSCRASKPGEWRRKTDEWWWDVAGWKVLIQAAREASEQTLRLLIWLFFRRFSMFCNCERTFPPCLLFQSRNTTRIYSTGSLSLKRLLMRGCWGWLKCETSLRLCLFVPPSEKKWRLALKRRLSRSANPSLHGWMTARWSFLSPRCIQLTVKCFTGHVVARVFISQKCDSIPANQLSRTVAAQNQNIVLFCFVLWTQQQRVECKTNKYSLRPFFLLFSKCRFKMNSCSGTRR